MPKMIKPCPFCGGEAKLLKYYESVDGLHDLRPRIRCKNCTVTMELTSWEINALKDVYRFKDGYISGNRPLWNAIHSKLADKWNERLVDHEDDDGR